ncbi:MAG: cytochrome P450 [Pseudomonadota bacterium]
MNAPVTNSAAEKAPQSKSDEPESSTAEQAPESPQETSGNSTQTRELSEHYWDFVGVDPYTIPLDELDVANPCVFQANEHWAWFKRLREEAPVHYCPESTMGPYWSVTTHADIMEVDTSHDIYSSEPTIVIQDEFDDFKLPMFIAMDPPKHDVQRTTVAPAVGPKALEYFRPIIEERTREVLDNLPVGEPFDWVKAVSVELTTRMLATLFDFPFEERSKLTWWSDLTTTIPGQGMVDTDEEWREGMMECLQYFMELWNKRAQEPPANDFISRLIYGEDTKNMEPMEYLGNLLLLIVGGNDTTRSTMTASVLCLDKHRDQFEEVRDNRRLINTMVSETIRWQTPLAHMRRTAKVDTVLGGKQIKAGDKVIMWYVSGNRDESVFPDADNFDIHRKDLRKHLSFGFGIHRCMGNRLAELQLRILWEELLDRYERIEVVSEPKRSLSVFVKGYEHMEVILHPRSTSA